MVYKPRRKKADLKTVIIAKTTKNYDNGSNNNSNSNNNNNNNGSSNNNNYNNNDINNPFKVVCPQSLVHNDRKQTIFKKKVQQIFRTLIEEIRDGQETKISKKYWCNQNETPNTTRLKARPA